MATIKYRARFSNGTELKRSSHRPYAAAWMVIVNHVDGSGYTKSGFSRTEQLARAALSSEAKVHSPGYSIGFAETAPVTIA